MLREVEEEANKLVSKNFSDSLWLMKALDELDSVKVQLTESIYKARVLVLNAMIVERLSCLNGCIYEDKIFTTIIKLDFAIKESERIARTPTLDHFQAYARCLLLERIAIWCKLEGRNEHGDREKLALDALRRASPVTQRLAAVCALETITLCTMLENITDLDAAKKLATDKHIGERLFGALQRGPSHNNALSYVCSITPRGYVKAQENSIEHDASKIWAVVDGPRFFQTLIWLLAFNKDLRYSSLSFMDAFLSALPDEPICDKLHSIEEASLSRKDVKVLLIACAQWSLLNWKQTNTPHNLLVAPTPVLFIRPPHGVNKFWNAVLVAVDSKRKLNTASIMAISTGLELTRLRGEIPDVRIVDAMRRWLVDHGDALGKWAYLASTVVVSLIKGTMHATREGLGSSQRVLPLLGEKGIPTMLEEEIYMDAERYLNEHTNNSEVSNGFHTTFELGAEASESTALEEVDTTDIGQLNGVKVETVGNSHKKGSSSGFASQPSLMAQLEVAAKLLGVVGNKKSCEPNRDFSTLDYRRNVLSRRDFLNLHQINGQQKGLLTMSKKHSKVGSSSNGDGGSAKDYQDESVDALCTAESCFQQKLDKLVDSMLCTLNTTAEVSSIDRSHQEDMQSFATHAYADGVYAACIRGWRICGLVTSRPESSGFSSTTGWCWAVGCPADGVTMFDDFSESCSFIIRMDADCKLWHFCANFGNRLIVVDLNNTFCFTSAFTFHFDFSLGVNDLPHDPRKCIGCADDDACIRGWRICGLVTSRPESSGLSSATIWCWAVGCPTDGVTIFDDISESCSYIIRMDADCKLWHFCANFGNRLIVVDLDNTF
uniref:Rapamycin-insensitive companion of mTOR domain-containing protein n=1 Tax=Ascaris lumbricoides TaxID=6252 RepID=A0A9J2Q5B0_ASCLU